MREAVLAVIERHVGLGHVSGETNYVCRCPFHKGGQEATPSFSVNLEKGVFFCFTCKRSGPLRWLLQMLDIPRPQIDHELREIQVELDLQRRLAELERKAEWQRGDQFEAEYPLPNTILAPYLKTRKIIPIEPTQLQRAGFKPSFLTAMEIGFDKKKERVIYPIRDIYGTLAGIVGGTIIKGREPKYLVYKGGYKDPDRNAIKQADFGPWFDKEHPDYVFHKSHYLWNYDNVYPRLFFRADTHPIIIVEGFKAAMWLLQHGYRNTVALMTSKISYLQKQQLLRLNAPVLLFLDNDQPGQEATKILRRELRQCMPRVCAIAYPEGIEPERDQPDKLTPEELASVLDPVIARFTSTPHSKEQAS